MSYESTAEPIKIGYLMDFLLGDYPKEMYEDLTIPFDMVFQDAFDKGLIDPSRSPNRPPSVPSGLPVPLDGFRIPR